jgi:hypothetical protein
MQRIPSIRIDTKSVIFASCLLKPGVMPKESQTSHLVGVDLGFRELKHADCLFNWLGETLIVNRWGLDDQW